MNLVVDASVAIKWFLAENLHAEARRLLDGDDILHAPDLLPVEMANAAWKKARRKEIDNGQARALALAHHRGVPALRPSADHVDRALQIALELDHPVYDCVYLACAEAIGAVLVTADKRLCEKMSGTSFDPLVRFLGAMGIGRLPFTLPSERVEALIHLSKQIEATHQNVYEKIRGQDPTQVNQFINLEKMAPYFRSPSMRRMRDAIARLPKNQQADLLALMWLGQDYSGDDFRSIRQRASQWIDGYSDKEYRYLVGLTVYLQRGWTLFQGTAGAEAEK